MKNKSFGGLFLSKDLDWTLEVSTGSRNEALAFLEATNHRSGTVALTFITGEPLTGWQVVFLCEKLQEFFGILSDVRVVYDE